jgi:xylulose-5-phosphate/fructose-6-phosphate phosphoketolase
MTDAAIAETPITTPLTAEELRLIVENMNYAHEHGADRPEITDWVWPL